MDAASWITIIGMLLNAITATSAAFIVYQTARDKLKFDTEKITMTHRIESLERQLNELKSASPS